LNSVSMPRPAYGHPNCDKRSLLKGQTRYFVAWGSAIFGLGRQPCYCDIDAIIGTLTSPEATRIVAVRKGQPAPLGSTALYTTHWDTIIVLQRDAREEVVQQAQLMIDEAFAVRGYTDAQVGPLLSAQSTVRFLPQTIPFFAAQTVFHGLPPSYHEYAYKEAHSIRPTLPIERPIGMRTSSTLSSAIPTKWTWSPSAIHRLA
jgi:hypothetical protein